MNGLHVGTSQLLRGGAGRFDHAASWLADEAAIPLSRSMPLSSQPETDDVVRSYLDNLLPDNRALRDRLEARRIAAAFGLPVTGAAMRTSEDRNVLVVERFDSGWP